MLWSMKTTRCPALPALVYCLGSAHQLPYTCKRLPMRPAYLFLCEVA